MKKKSAKLMSSSLLLALLLIWGIPPGKSQALEVGMAEAVALALQHNLDFQLVTLDWQEARAALKRAQIVGDGEMIAEAAQAWEKADRHYLESRQNLINLVRSAYQEVLQGETALANSWAAQERAEAQLKIDENKYKAGLLSSLDVERAKISLANARHSYETALVNMKTQRLEFKRLLGLDFQEELVLSEKMLLDFLPFPWELEEAYFLALERDGGVWAARESLKKAEERALAARSPFTPQAELEQALVAVQKAEIEVKRAEEALYFQIRRAYYDLQNLAHRVRSKEWEIEFEGKILQAEESKYAAGVVSNAQIVAQQEKVAQVEREYNEALLQYNLSRTGLLQAVGQPDCCGGEENED